MLTPVDEGSEITTLLKALSPAHPGAVPPLSDEQRERLEDHLDRLKELGFEVGVAADSLRIRNPGSAFETEVSLDEDDLAVRRDLFRALNRTFGGYLARLSWFFRPGPSVTLPYESLKVVLDSCRTARTRAGRSEQRRH